MIVGKPVGVIEALRPTQRGPGRLVLTALILGAAVPLLGGVGAFLSSGATEYAYPALALAMGAFLYWRHPAVYLGFTWWIWLFTPAVRRFVDLQQGWNPESPVMLAPYLVTALTFFAVVRHLPKLRVVRLAPFGLVFAGLLYGYVVGALNAGLPAATFDLLNWLVPATFAFYIAVHWQRYPLFREVVQGTFVWGVLLLGAYGVLQYFDPPAWDRYWMLNAPIESIGLPNPFEVRVFSTLNSQTPFAVVMSAGLFLLLSGGGALRWPASAVGYASFLLSLVRSTWGGWAVGIFFLATTRSRLRSRLLVVSVVSLLLVLPLLSAGPVAETLGPRLQTLGSIGDDVSFNARLEFYSEFAPQAFFNPIGDGIGSVGVATKLGADGGELGELGNFDSGIMIVPFTMGWPGTLLYLTGLCCLLVQSFAGGRQRDAFANVSQAIVVSVLAQLVFTNLLTGVAGMVLWSFVAFSAVAGHYYKATSEAPSASRSPPVEPPGGHRRRFDGVLVDPTRPKRRED